jgi:hypothetical protein
MAGSGCGCLAVTHCVMEIKDVTPKYTYPFMKNYAVAGHGTKWIGIIEGLKHFGLSNVKEIGTFPELWPELAKGNRVGVLLFGSRRAPDGRIFTSGGHYIAFTDYKRIGKKHYLYLKDSGGRNNSGWLCFESSIAGTVAKIWIGTLPKPKVALPSRGYYKVGDKGQNVRTLQDWLNANGFDCGAEDGIYGANTAAGVKKFERKYKLKVDGLWGKKCQRKYEELI